MLEQLLALEGARGGPSPNGAQGIAFSAGWIAAYVAIVARMDRRRDARRRALHQRHPDVIAVVIATTREARRAKNRGRSQDARQQSA